MKIGSVVYLLFEKGAVTRAWAVALPNLRI